MRFPILIAASSATLCMTMSGCTSRSTTFEGYAGDQVWSAVVAAARSPEYDDWKLAQNDVFVDEAGRRVEIFRRLKRLYVTPYADPRKEEEEWRVQVTLSNDSADGSSVEFTARQVSIPAHVWREADRYFEQVRSLLGPPKQSDSPTSPSADQEPAPSAELDAADAAVSSRNAG